jgi:hypothetical protein
LAAVASLQVPDSRGEILMPDRGYPIEYLGQKVTVGNVSPIEKSGTECESFLDSFLFVSGSHVVVLALKSSTLQNGIQKLIEDYTVI